MSFRGITVTTPSPTVRLTTLTRLKSELGVTSTSDDTILGEALDRASQAAETYCHRVFNRQSYTEAGPAFGGVEFQCKHAPVVALGTVTFDSQTLTDVSIGDRDQGVLYRESGFMWTAQAWGGLAGGQKLWDFGTPIPGQEEPLWSVSYTAGFVPPGYVITKPLTALTSDNSFNSTSEGFASIYAYLKAGDVIRTSGFTATVNNGGHVISGTPTASKIIVTTTLSTGDTATSTAARQIDPQTLPKDVEQATIETAKTFYSRRKDDSKIVEKQMQGARVRFAEQGGEGDIGLPPRAVGLLRPWVRAI